MKKGTTSSAAGGKKNAVIPIASKADRPTAATSTKRKEDVVAVAVEAANTANTANTTTAATSTLPTKKTKYNEATSTTNGSSTSLSTSSSTSTATATATTSSILPKSNGVEIQFTFGTLPTIPSATTSTSSSSSSTTTSQNSYYRATVLVCHRKTLQQMVQNGGNELLNSMLHLSISDRTLQAMYTDCCGSGGSGGSSSPTTVVSSYVDYDMNVNVTPNNNSKDDDDKHALHHHHHQQQHPHHKMYIIALPDTVSRNNHIWSVHSITDCIKQSCSPRKEAYHCRFVFCGPNISSMVGSLSSSVARAFSVYTRKSSSSSSSSSAASSSTLTSQQQERQPTQHLHISFMDVSENGIVEYLPSSSSSSVVVVESGKDQQHQYSHLKDLCSSIQYAAQLVDMTPEELTTTFYAEECRRIVSLLQSETKQHVVTYKEIVGTELDTLGYGGLYGIGKAATCPPYMVLIEYIPTATTLDTSSSTLPYDESIALVGKGIVYDTGGLSLKSKDGMPGMKYDMGGSAGLFGAFITAVQMRLRKRLLLILCLAENAIGPTAVRNDDILTLYSGKTVEVNNTDAEGRLVLADGVAHASKHFVDCNVIIDMATLTGAQLVATGKTHAGILANTIELEQRIVHAGLRSGDLVTPMLYAPELLLKEFDSKIADMKNSVKDRSNAQASCAGHFIESHLCPSYTGGWIHIDMAGPADKDGRGTAYGVALILAFLNAPGF